MNWSWLQRLTWNIRISIQHFWLRRWRCGLLQLYFSLRRWWRWGCGHQEAGSTFGCTEWPRSVRRRKSRSVCSNIRVTANAVHNRGNTTRSNWAIIHTQFAGIALSPGIVITIFALALGTNHRLEVSVSNGARTSSLFLAGIVNHLADAGTCAAAAGGIASTTFLGVCVTTAHLKRWPHENAAFVQHVSIAVVLTETFTTHARAISISVPAAVEIRHAAQGQRYVMVWVRELYKLADSSGTLRNTTCMDVVHAVQVRIVIMVIVMVVMSVVMSGWWMFTVQNGLRWIHLKQYKFKVLEHES